MATNTPNYNLSVPDDTDKFSDTVQAYRDNLVIIDNNLGGGGGGGGDVAVYGTFINTNDEVYNSFIADGNEHSWTATEDCIIGGYLDALSPSESCYVTLDGLDVFIAYGTHNGICQPVMRGQVVTYKAKSGSSFKAYGIYQGTNGIFAPIIYSDTEREVGTWRDNKPLYKRTWKFNSTVIVNANTWTSLGISSGDIENVVMSETLDDEGRSNKVAYCGVRNSYISVYSTLGTNIETVTLYYTKTTDTAGSGNWNVDGVPTHHYSTSEQVIGKWIDGKPLYECTISVDNPTKLSASGKYYYDVIYNRSDIEYAQLAFCSVFDSVDGRWFPLPYQRIISSENIDILAQVRADGSFQVTAHFPTSAWYNLTKIRYTVQYTKTTD